MNILNHAEWQIGCVLPVVLSTLGCMPSAVRSTNDTTTRSYSSVPGAVVEFRVDPQSTVRGPAVHVDGEWDVRVQKLANTYVVYVMPRGVQTRGSVHIVAGPHDDVRVQVGRLPSATKMPEPCPPVTKAPPRAPRPVAVAPPPVVVAPQPAPVAPPLTEAPPSGATGEEPDAGPTRSDSGSARQRLRSGTLDTSNPWAP